jgi:hypothetical protein
MPGKCVCNIDICAYREGSDWRSPVGVGGLDRSSHISGICARSWPKETCALDAVHAYISAIPLPAFALMAFFFGLAFWLAWNIFSARD